MSYKVVAGLFRHSLNSLCSFIDPLHPSLERIVGRLARQCFLKNCPRGNFDGDEFTTIKRLSEKDLDSPPVFR